MLSQQDEVSLEILAELKKIGIKLSIDDFGSRFSAMGYFQHFLIDRLKVDRGFTKELISSRESAVVAAAVIGLANNLELEVIAAGVDDANKVDLLQQYGCYIFQGYYFSEPLNTDEFELKYRNASDSNP